MSLSKSRRSLSYTVIIVLLLIIQTQSTGLAPAFAATTTYGWSSLGSTDSGGTGFRTVTLTASGQSDVTGIIVSNVFAAAGTELYPDSGGRTGTVRIKADGSDITQFDLHDMTIYSFNAGTTVTTFDMTLYDSSGAEIGSKSLSGDHTFSANVDNSLADIYGSFDAVSGVSEIEIYIEIHINSLYLRQLTFKDITLENISAEAPAEPPELSDFSPERNAWDVGLGSTVVLTYSADIDASTVTSQTVAVHSMMHGLVTANPSTADNKVTVTPNDQFFPGEMVYTSATTGTMDITGTHPLSPTVWQFQVGAPSGNGRFGSTPVATSEATERTWAVAWADYDGDGDLDLAAGSYGPTVVYRNDGSGAFDATTTLAASSNAYAAVWGDYDGDGDLDLAVGSYSATNYIYPQTGPGTFGAPISFGSGHAFALAWGDADGDGDLDLAVGNYYSQSELCLNLGGGVFDCSTKFGPSASYSYAVAWGDADNDGDLDLAIGYDTAQNYIYLNDGHAQFPSSWPLPAAGGNNTVALAWGDVDGDGDLDLAIGNRTEQDALCINPGTAPFDCSLRLGAATSSYGMAWGDVDGDGDLDLAVTNSEGQDLVYVNASGSITVTNVISVGESSANTVSVAWGDFDGDGDLDLAMGGYEEPDVVYLNEPALPEPSNHPTGFTATADSSEQVTTSWTDSAAGAQAPEGYLVLCNTTGTFSDPVDGTAQADDTACADGSGVVNIAHGAGGSYAWTDLNGGTQYYYTIYPYTNSGAEIDYKIDGTPPTANATTETATCTASGSGTVDWATAFSGCAAGSNRVIPDGVTIVLDGNVEIDGDLEIQGSGSFDANGKRVTLTGGDGQTLTGDFTFYMLTVDKDNASDTVTISGSLDVTRKLRVRKGKLISASDYEDIEIDADGELVLTGDITVSGHFTNTGTLTTDGNGIIFDGGVEQHLLLNVVTTFDDLTVSTGTTLIETNSGDNGVIDGTLTNNGTIRKAQTVDFDDEYYYFGLAGLYPNSGGYGMEIYVEELAVSDPLTGIQVDRVDSDHANAPSGEGTGIYWSITPTGSGFTATVALPYTGTLSSPLACRWMGTAWDCGYTEHYGDPDWYVVREEVTAFSDWAVFDGQPLAVDLAGFGARVEGQAIELAWQTANELETLGFHVWRASGLDMPRERLTQEMMVAQSPGSVMGAAYAFRDETALPGVTYAYWLEAVDVSGESAFHGPRYATVAALQRLRPARERLIAVRVLLQSR